MDNILLLPEKATRVNAKMVYIGYKSLIPTGGRKRYKLDKNGIPIKRPIQPRIVKAMAKANKTELTGEDFRKRVKGLCYCFKCKSEVIVKTEEYSVNKYNLHHGRIHKIYECPTCGQRVNEDDIFQLNTIYTVYRQYFLDGNLLKLKRKEYVFGWYNNHLFIDETKQIYTMNLDTGYTYMLSAMKNGKYVGKGIFNATYSLRNLDRNYPTYSDKCKNHDDFYKEVYELVRNYKMNKLGFFIPTFDCYRNLKLNDEEINRHYYLQSSPDVENVVLLNRFPSMPPYISLRHFTGTCSDKNHIAMRRSIKCTSKDYIKDILEHYGLPVTKTTKRRTISNLSYPVMFIKLYNEIGNYDNVNKILDEEKCSSLSLSNIDSMVKQLKAVKDIKGFNMNSFCNRLENVDIYTVIDILRLIEQIYKKKADYNFNFKCQLKELHDKLAIDYNKLRHENVVIEYAEEYKILEGKYGELNFAFAKDTHELIEVGTYMGICVGGYGDRAVSKKLNIMVARDNEHNPIICIEMDKHYFTLAQTKLKYNHTIKENTIEYAAIEEWAIKNCLEFNTYYDIPDELHNRINELKEVTEKRKKINDLIEKERKENEVPDNRELRYRPVAVPVPLNAQMARAF